MGHPDLEDAPRGPVYCIAISMSDSSSSSSGNSRPYRPAARCSRQACTALSRRRWLVATCWACIVSAAAAQSTNITMGAVQTGLSVLPSQYPAVRRDNVTDDFFGTVVADPYRWLEDTDSNETLAFVAAQNALTDSVLAECDTRDKFKELMTQMYNFPKLSCPFQRGEPGGVLRWYYTSNTGLQAQSVLYTQAEPDAPASVLLDPNTLSADGTVALNDYSFSWDGSLLAYSLSSGGSDWEQIKVLRIDNSTGAVSDLNDTLSNVKFSTTAWSPDNKGFFYNQYPAPNNTNFNQLGTNTGANANQQLWYHAVGTPQDDDIFVLALPEQPLWSMAAGYTADKKYIVFTISTGTDPANKLWYIDAAALPVNAKTGAMDLTPYDRQKGAAAKPLPIVKLIDDFRASFSVIANDGPVWTLSTDLNATRSKLVRTNITEASDPSTWQVVIPEDKKNLLSSASALKGDALVVTYMRDVATILQLHSLSTGALVRELPMPGYGSIKEFCGRPSLSQFYYSFQSMTDPGSTYTYDTATPMVDPVEVPDLSIEIPGGYSAKGLQTLQVFVPSKDGTVKIPMFIVAHKNVTLDGQNPTWLYAYGGFGITTEPTFSVSRLAYILAYGGVYAIAGIRGGGEEGVAWWQEGHLLKKQNSFDDFASCAQYLHSAGYSSPAKLTIQGGSNGGLLMGAQITQHPDLYAAVISQVGVYDMLRFQLFTIGHAWMSEYGDPTNETDFEYMIKYSPLHNVRVPGGSHQYPAAFLTTADHDDRVVPLHSYKFISTLQHVLAGYQGSPQRNPLLLHVESRAGHGGGMPTDKVIEEYSDFYGFAAKAMNAKWILQKPATAVLPANVAG